MDEHFRCSAMMRGDPRAAMYACGVGSNKKKLPLPQVEEVLPRRTRLPTPLCSSPAPLAAVTAVPMLSATEGFLRMRKPEGTCRRVLPGGPLL
jgi:hypothetical protein